MKHVKSNDIHECVRGLAAGGGSAAILETVKRLNADLSIENGFLAEKVLKAARRTTIHFAADEKRALAEAAHELQRMDLEALRRRYREVAGEPPRTNSAPVLRTALAWRIQERALGGFTEEENRQLEKAAKSAGRRKAELLPGTRLVRTWHGKDYVAVARDGGVFEFDGRVFRSLTALATHITGSKWNGRAFFGIGATA